MREARPLKVAPLRASRTAASASDRAPSLSLATVMELLTVCGDLLTARAISLRLRPEAMSSSKCRSNGVSRSRTPSPHDRTRRSRAGRSFNTSS